MSRPVDPCFRPAPVDASVIASRATGSQVLGCPPCATLEDTNDVIYLGSCRRTGFAFDLTKVHIALEDAEPDFRPRPEVGGMGLAVLSHDRECVGWALTSLGRKTGALASHNMVAEKSARYKL